MLYRNAENTEKSFINSVPQTVFNIIFHVSPGLTLTIYIDGYFLTKAIVQPTFSPSNWSSFFFFLTIAMYIEQLHCS